MFLEQLRDILKYPEISLSSFFFFLITRLCFLVNDLSSAYMALIISLSSILGALLCGFTLKIPIKRRIKNQQHYPQY